MQDVFFCHKAHRYEVTGVKLTAVDRDRVDLIEGIRRTDVAMRRMARSSDLRADHLLLPVQRTPLALDPQDSAAEIKREVIVSMLGYRRQYGDSGIKGLSDDLRFGDGPLVVRAVHEQMFPRRAIPNKTTQSGVCELG
jgi:hypothetical protein